MAAMLLWLLSGCKHADEPQLPVTPVNKVVLVYMEAKNNLYTFAYDDLAEMKQADIPDGCRLLVYKSIRGESHPTLVEITGGADTVVKHYPDTVSAIDPDHMRLVIDDVRALAPAEHMGLVLWSHSSGWRQKAPARVAARGYGLENGWQMTMTQLGMALNGQGLDFLMFDTCYMGSVEVAFELRDAARWMVASVCEVPTRGMPYHLTVPYLFADSVPQGLSRVIDLNVDFYLNDPAESCPSTMSLIDLSKLMPVAEAVRDRMQSPLPADYKAQAFSVASPYKYLFFDLGQYMEALGADMQTLSDAVVYERHTPKIWNSLPLEHCSGLSVYIPQLTPGDLYTNYGYDSLQWYQIIRQGI